MLYSISDETGRTQGCLEWLSWQGLVESGSSSCTLAAQTAVRPGNLAWGCWKEEQPAAKFTPVLASA